MKKKLEKIYYKLPLSLQNIAISIFGYSWNNRRYGGIFKSELQKAIDRESNTKAQWDEYQQNLLNKLILHSFDTVAYYRNMFERLNLTREQLLGFKIKDLPKLPFLEKQTFRKLGDSELLSSNRAKWNFSI